MLKERQQLVINLNQADLNLETDPRVLRGVLFNLISNAAKYSDPGKTIRISVTNTNLDVTIEIQDEGIGIPQSEVKHLFDRFFRASNAANIQGTGLGLNIVKRYLDLLEGNIIFTSIEGKGSIFKITLPINKP